MWSKFADAPLHGPVKTLPHTGELTRRGRAVALAEQAREAQDSAKTSHILVTELYARPIR